MIGRIIETDACVTEGAEWLAAREPRFAEALALTGPLPLRRREDGFAALLSAIVSQQISVAAANGVWAKMEAAGAVTAEGVAKLDDEELRACGLSRQKAVYARAIAESGLDFRELRALPNDAAQARLVAIKGVGVWTAEVYLMFSLGRADIFAAGDLALQEAARMLFELPQRPKDKEIRAMAEEWSPWRSVAARALWAYYRVAKQREGVR